MTNRTFFFPDFGRYVLFKFDVLEKMYAHAQRRCWQKEAGGEVYAYDPDANGLIISAATGPNPGDRRGRNSFNPDVEATARDRMQHFSHGRHAIGLWHTHPEQWPEPSGQDHRTTMQYLDAFGTDRSRYLLVILGNVGAKPNLAVWCAEENGEKKWVKLIEVDAVSYPQTLRAKLPFRNL